MFCIQNGRKILRRKNTAPWGSIRRNTVDEAFHFVSRQYSFAESAHNDDVCRRRRERQHAKNLQKINFLNNTPLVYILLKKKRLWQPPEKTFKRFSKQFFML